MSIDPTRKSEISEFNKSFGERTFKSDKFRDESFDNFSEIDEPVEIVKEYPYKFTLRALKKEPHVKFDKYLMLVEDRNDFFTAREDNSFELTPIPKFIAYTTLVIRAKFEEELKIGKCFLESKHFPSNEVIESLAENIYLDCDEYNSVIETTENYNCLTVFLVLLSFLQKLELRIFQCSREILRYIKEYPIFEYIRPRDFVILDQIHCFISQCFVSIGASELTHGDKKEPNISLDLIDNLLHSYYNTATLSRTDVIKRRNQLHQLYYHDLRALKSTTHRYLVRFVLRNCLYYIRRYVCKASSNLRRLRKEDLQTSIITCVPFINCFAIYRMAQFLAGQLTEIHEYTDSLDNRVLYLMNILSIHMENIWFRQRKISQLMENTEIEHCHKNCPCRI